MPLARLPSSSPDSVTTPGHHWPALGAAAGGHRRGAL